MFAANLFVIVLSYCYDFLYHNMLIKVFFEIQTCWIAPQATVINIPIAYSNEDFINPLNLSRAISTAIEQGVNIIHCAACHPTQSGLAHEFIDKAIRQAQANNILVIAPGGNDKGECWCVPAVLENVLTVGAMKDTGEPFKFSNFGGKYATQGILAPGENIFLKTSRRQ